MVLQYESLLLDYLLNENNFIHIAKMHSKKTVINLYIHQLHIKLMVSLYPYANIVSFLHLCQSFIKKYHISLHKCYLEEKLP